MHSRLFCLFQGRFRPTSCVEYGQQGAYKDGIYKIYDNDGNSFPAYCDLKSEPGIAWTLVMSWSRENRVISAFKNAALQVNAPENENSPNYDRYRLSLERMRSLQVHFTHWRATCSYPTHGIDFTDYLRGNFKDFDIVDFQGHGECKRVKYWISEGTMARTLQHRFGRERTLGCCIMTAVWFSASSTQPLEQYRMKTTLASMKALIPSSAAHRKTALLLSGGLELILKNSFRKMKLHSSHVRTKGACELYHLYKQMKCIQY